MIATEEKMYSRLMPLKEAAAFLGISVETLRKWVQHGRVESHKLEGLRQMSEDEVIRIIEESRVPAVSETRPRVRSVTTKTQGRFTVNSLIFNWLTVVNKMLGQKPGFSAVRLPAISPSMGQSEPSAHIAFHRGADEKLWQKYNAMHTINKSS
jgi:excisionase family DNA binding protein